MAEGVIAGSSTTQDPDGCPDGRSLLSFGALDNDTWRRLSENPCRGDTIRHVVKTAVSTVSYGTTPDTSLRLPVVAASQTNAQGGHVDTVGFGSAALGADAVVSSGFRIQTALNTEPPATDPNPTSGVPVDNTTASTGFVTETSNKPNSPGLPPPAPSISLNWTKPTLTGGRKTSSKSQVDQTPQPVQIGPSSGEGIITINPP